MSNALIRKLSAVWQLSEADRQALMQLCDRRVRVAEDRDIAIEGEKPSTVHLILEGLAFRYKYASDGRRQILALLLPGDFCDLHVPILGQRDHSIAALTSCKIVEISHPVILNVMAQHPAIAQAFWWTTLQQESISREWSLSLGRRDATERMSHFFCEMFYRCDQVGLVTNRAFALPLKQVDLADLLGLSQVHTNRTLQALRGKGLILLASKQLTILDLDRLATFCRFDPNYLHLRGPLGN